MQTKFTFWMIISHVKWIIYVFCKMYFDATDLFTELTVGYTLLSWIVCWAILYCSLCHNHIFIFSVSTKHRQLNWLRPKIHLKSHSNRILINFCDPNLLSESVSSWQIQLIQIQIISKVQNRSKDIKNISKVIKFNQKIEYVLTF